MLGQGITNSVVGHCLMVQSFVAARFVTTRSSKSYSIKEWECPPLLVVFSDQTRLKYQKRLL